MGHKRADLAFFVHIDVNKFVFAAGVIKAGGVCAILLISLGGMYGALGIVALAISGFMDRLPNNLKAIFELPRHLRGDKAG
ncbi:hypothetical protein DL239_05810 [Sedimentitalea sp. CY04]|uniref:Uncharacterized protein n=1 Tax=Parasedimentitalea denitrificans TaxID=2211118 RepID=A0ABX0W4B7_9RHOB|nr:hypothetical protein [Sedimentitalea sp. CY04]NIZ60490.1 hypothetical protein [Sedimentitalea sp. CY04]